MNKSKRTEQEQQELLEYIRERYVYDATTGRIRHKSRDRPLVTSKNGTTRYGHIRIRWKRAGRTLDVHRVVWALFYGRWPVGTIDHLDNNPLNNRIENLRECSQSENNLNVLHPWQPNEVTGVPGVSPNKSSYQSRVCGKQMYFTSPFEAFFIATLCGKRYRCD